LQRFAQLSRYLPVLPVFGNGGTRFQPIYVGDIGRLVEILTRDNSEINVASDGRIIEAGGPDSEFFSPNTDCVIVTHIRKLVLTFRQIMELVVKYTGRYRPIIPVPWLVGELQGEILQRLPRNIFTVTRDQVRLI
jgi:hypothetical protein